VRSVNALMAALCLIMGLTGCAGPTTPFGALNGFGDAAEKVGAALFGGLPSGTHIRFTPRRQVLHDRTTFDVIIDDPSGVPEDHKLVFIYNGKDMTASFLRGADWTYMDPNHRQLRLTTKNLRLLPARDHAIRVIYKRNSRSEPVMAEYRPPSCQAFEPERSIASIPKFDAPPEFVQMINKHARREKLNPYYLAGLIAQESGFDPLAISSAKAVGLTQMTSLGEGEVIKANKKFPRYPGIDEMSVLELRLNVYHGKINSSNEWRLNPEMSIHGGADYLTYLRGYWARPEKRPLLKQAELSEVLLASYNSGAARVTRAIERNGADWLQDEELEEARKYVRRVTSYCDHFAHGKDFR
jgi:hypothetical protein